MTEHHTEPWEVVKTVVEAQTETGKAAGEAMEYLAKSIVDLENYALRLGNRIERLEKVAPPREAPHHVPTKSDQLRCYGLPPRYSVEVAHVVNVAIDLALEHAWVEGENHRVWVIDQMIRVLSGENYERIIKRWEEDNKGEDWDEEWDTGVAP